ncbi:FRG domain-containing protein [Mesorhizobium koreense]|uniref:FRG domain-containing protein n=1 Tax=Mesorhizobium koreense TaxID=3074855 RepID=UPI00287BC913|nr:FRG domain-containing protein [Mesorhizobium sp. WR6]
MPFNKFFEDIEAAKRRTRTSNGGAWYRGVGDGRYKLLPSLLRFSRPHPKAEANLYADFWTMVEGTAIEETWERLSFMQHFGVPTRLLDWTTDLNVALYFAIAYSRKHGTGDPCIWVLNPYRLNIKYKGNMIIYDKVDQVDFHYYDAVRANSFPDMPIAMRPAWSNPRVRAQSGAFTLHGSIERPLEDLVDSRIVTRVLVNHSSVDAIREKLIAEGVNDFRMMPGPEGLALYLRKLHLNV